MSARRDGKWTRLFVVVLILLVLAGVGYYGLSSVMKGGMLSALQLVALGGSIVGFFYLLVNLFKSLIDFNLWKIIQKGAFLNRSNNPTPLSGKSDVDLQKLKTEFLTDVRITDQLFDKSD